jgi:hypothetical protein
MRRVTLVPARDRRQAGCDAAQDRDVSAEDDHERRMPKTRRPRRHPDTVGEPPRRSRCRAGRCRRPGRWSQRETDLPERETVAGVAREARETAVWTANARDEALVEEGGVVIDDDRRAAFGRDDELIDGDERASVRSERAYGRTSDSGTVGRLASFVESWPQIEVELVADDRFLNLSKREADMAVGNTRPKGDTGVVVRRFCALGNGVYASGAYVARHGRPGPGFEGHTMISDEPGPSIANRWIAENAARAKVVLRSNATAVHVEALRAGIGIALLSTYHVYDDPNVVEIISPTLLPKENMWLALHKDLQHNARIRACADFLTAEIAKLEKRLRGVWAKSA